jgi:hypothetical protein
VSTQSHYVVLTAGYRGQTPKPLIWLSNSATLVIIKFALTFADNQRS